MLEEGSESMKFDDDEDDLERCRRARREVDAQFKNLDEMFDVLAKMDRERMRKGAASNSRKSGLPSATKAKSPLVVKQKRKATKG